MEGVISEHDVVKRDVSLLSQVKKLTTTRDGERENFGGSVGGRSDDKDASICPIIPHESERVEDEEQISRQQQQEDERGR